jgi:hypothetical protein
MVYFGWENQTGPRDRQLFEFRSHLKFLHWLAATDGLQPWNAGARYPARNSEVQNCNANMIITYGGEHVSR